MADVDFEQKGRSAIRILAELAAVVVLAGALGVYFGDVILSTLLVLILAAVYVRYIR